MCACVSDACAQKTHISEVQTVMALTSMQIFNFHDIELQSRERGRDGDNQNQTDVLLVFGGVSLCSNIIMSETIGLSGLHLQVLQ